MSWLGHRECFSGVRVQVHRWPASPFVRLHLNRVSGLTGIHPVFTCRIGHSIFPVVLLVTKPFRLFAEHGERHGGRSVPSSSTSPAAVLSGYEIYGCGRRLTAVAKRFFFLRGCRPPACFAKAQTRIPMNCRMQAFIPGVRATGAPPWLDCLSRALHGWCSPLPSHATCLPWPEAHRASPGAVSAASILSLELPARGQSPDPKSSRYRGTTA